MLEPIVLGKLALMEQAIAQCGRSSELRRDRESGSEVKATDVGQITVEVLTKLSIVNTLLKSSTNPNKLAKLEPIISKVAEDACGKLQQITTSAGLAGSSLSLAINVMRIAIGAKNIVDLRKAITVLESQVKGLTDNLMATAQGAYPGAEIGDVLGKNCLELINAPKKNIRSSALKAYNNTREVNKVLKEVHQDAQEYAESPASPEDRHNSITPYEKAVLIGRLNPTSGSKVTMSPGNLLRTQREYLAKAGSYLEQQVRRAKSTIKKPSVSDRELINSIHEDLSNTIGFAPDDASLEIKAQYDYQRNLAQKAMRAASTERILRHTKRAKDAQIIKTGLAGAGMVTGAVGLAAGILLTTQGAALPALVGMGLMGADLIKMAAGAVVDARAPSENPALDRIVNSKIDNISMDINGGGYYMQSMEALVDECSELMDEVRNRALYVTYIGSVRDDIRSREKKNLLEAADELRSIIANLGPNMHQNPLVSREIEEQLKKIREKIRTHSPPPKLSAEDLRNFLLPIDWSPYVGMIQDVHKEILEEGAGLDEESKKILNQALQEHVVLKPEANAALVEEQELPDGEESDGWEFVVEEEEDHWVLTEDLKPMYASDARDQRIKFFTPFGYAPEAPSLFRYGYVLAPEPLSTKSRGVSWIPESLRRIFSSPIHPGRVVSGPSLFYPGSRFSPHHYPILTLPPRETYVRATVPTAPARVTEGVSLFSPEAQRALRACSQPFLEQPLRVPTRLQP